MLKQRVIVEGPKGSLYGREGVIVAVNSFFREESGYENAIYCKVLIEDKITNWIPYEWLRFCRCYGVFGFTL